MDLRTLLQDVADLYEPLVEDAGAKLALALPDRPATVRGNRDLLFQACANLIDNAIEYGLGVDDPPPAATIDLKLDLDGETARLSVRDRGAGLHGAALERARERFYRADASRSTGGSGLGLSLVDAVARLHGGALILAPAAPGLRATVSLPLDKRAAPNEKAEETLSDMAGAAATEKGAPPG